MFVQGFYEFDMRQGNGDLLHRRAYRLRLHLPLGSTHLYPYSRPDYIRSQSGQAPIMCQHRKD